MARTKPHKQLRIRVDPTRCTAFGFCAEFLPEHFTLDEWGYAWLKEREADGHSERLVRQTARLCPRSAIAVDDVAVDPRTKANGSPLPEFPNLRNRRS